MNAKATSVKRSRVTGVSVVTGRLGRNGRDTALSDMAVSSPAVCLQEIDQEKRRERDRQHDRGDAGSPGVIKFLELDDDEQRRDLGNVRHVSGDEDDGAVFPDSPREREGE